MQSAIFSTSHSSAKFAFHGSDAKRSARLKCSATAAEHYGWIFDDKNGRKDPKVRELPLSKIRRPLTGTRRNDQAKVEALMESISEIGLKEPIEVLEVEGAYYGFSGCHRFEACQRLGMETIKCRVRQATKKALRMHFM